MIFPMLYKKNAHGTLSAWQVSTTALGQVQTRWGNEGAVAQVTVENVAGKKNTTAESQAVILAEQRWNAKKKKGYVESADAAMAGKVDTEVIKGGINPMLAQKFESLPDNAFVQPKLDGHRCVAICDFDTGKVTLWSRTRKPITSMPHIVRDLQDTMEPGDVFDGELYVHGEKFEEMTSLIRAKEPKPGHERIQYHVYDLAGKYAEDGFEARHEVLGHGFGDHVVRGSVHYVETWRIGSEEHLAYWTDIYINRGYEGAMVRDGDAPYEFKRTKALQKVKKFDDAEFQVIGVDTGKGKMEGLAIFVCAVGNGETFRCKMMGGLEELRKYVDEPSLALDKMLTVKYQGLTDKGIPRFPVGLRFREEV